MTWFWNKGSRKSKRPGSVANNTRRNAGNAVKRVERASNNILNTAVQRVHNNASRRRAAGTMNANQNAQVNKELEKIEGIRSELSAATKRIVDESIEDIKEQAIRYSKDEDPTLFKKLEKQLTKVLSGDTRSPSDPKVKAILKWILPIFLFTAPYIRFKGFKYDASSNFYEYLAEFVENMKHGMTGGAHNDDANDDDNTTQHVYGGVFWSVNYMSSLLTFNLLSGGLVGGSADAGPFVAFILMFYFGIIVLVFGLSVGAVTLNVFTYIGSAVYDRVKKMTKSKGGDMEDAKHAIVTSNILSEKEANKIVVQENPSYQAQHYGTRRPPGPPPPPVPYHRGPPRGPPPLGRGRN